MVRSRPRKTTIGLTDESVMRTAVNAVLQNKKSLREAANDYSVPKSTLARYVKKCKENGLTACPTDECGTSCRHQSDGENGLLLQCF